MTDILVTTPPTVNVIVQAAAPKGEKGDSGIALTYLAAQDLGGHRAVYVSAAGAVDYVDGTLSSLQRYAGITTHAASSGWPVIVQSVSEADEPSWSWTPGGLIFAAADGLLTQTAPSSGVLLSIGIAITANRIFLFPSIPLQLS